MLRPPSATCNFSENDQALNIINAAPSVSGATGVPGNARNPYRSILRRRYPQPLVVLLALILGIWIWDHYFSPDLGYAPGTEEIALIKIDRDLRLADAMHADPEWLKWMVSVEDPVAAREKALKVLQNLAAEDALQAAGREAFTVIQSVHENLPMMEGRAISDGTETARLLANHQGSWWQAKMIDALESQHGTTSAHSWKSSFETDNQQLRKRVITVRGSLWLLGLIGMFFLRSTLVSLIKGLGNREQGYGGAWKVNPGITIFMMATLAWIGFTMTMEIGISLLPGLHPAMGILLDSAARMLPPLIAMALLFLRPSHAARVLGLARPVAIRSLLGLFSLLMVMDPFLKFLLARDSAGHPGGSLGVGESGLWGLAFAVVSACLLAPLAEELLYRGILFRTLWNRLGVMAAAVISSLVFALMHFYSGYGLASVALFGLACCLLYAATGSLTSTIGLHVLYNSSIKIPEWLIYHQGLG